MHENVDGFYDIIILRVLNRQTHGIDLKNKYMKMYYFSVNLFLHKATVLHVI